MKYSFLGIGFIMFGLVGIVFVAMFQSITVDNEAEYYVLKEAMEASMLESIDLTCYKRPRQDEENSSEKNNCGGILKISEQKFVENFTRRFANNISGDAKEYTIEFYDIIESPPKATIAIKGLTKEYNIVGEENGFNITNSLSGILEFSKEIEEDREPIMGWVDVGFGTTGVGLDN